jgi:toxin ParE1/3/4
MKIEWTESAISDLEHIRNFIGKDSEYYASRFIGKIIKAVERLVDYPKIGRRVPEAEGENVRELIFQNYRIMYFLKNGHILILAIIHGARQMFPKKPKPWDII